jgi:hypothetical protein
MNTNFAAHAVKVYFDNGGALLYFSRVFANNPAAAGSPANTPPDSGIGGTPVITLAGVSTAATPASPNGRFVARFPGVEGNGIIQVDLIGVPCGPNAQAALPTGSTLRFAPAAAGGSPTYYVKQGSGSFTVNGSAAAGAPAPAQTAMPTTGATLVTLTITATSASGAYSVGFTGLGLDPSHPQYIGNVLAATPSGRQAYLENMFALVVTGPPTASDLATILFEAVTGGSQPAANTLPVNTLARNIVPLTGGDDGGQPTAQAYANALVNFEPLEDISIVAAPGSSAYGALPDSSAAVAQALIEHVSRPRAYRVAVLDSPPNYLVSDISAYKSEMDSTYAALYYPWVRIANPLALSNNSQVPQEINLPPSGFVCGIYARSDSNYGVFKAPANEIVSGALRFERDVSFGDQSVLNPLGINCLRSLPNRGNRVWGARTISSDPNWTYLNVRRYMLYLEASIDQGTQWAVFEGNGPQLWTNIRETIGSFLNNEWRSGALLGDTPAQAYFVKCDRSTMTQSNLDNGQLVCLIGVAVIKPAEFVIFRIGQKTADASS